MLLRDLRRGFAPVGLKTPWRFSHRRETSWRSVQIGVEARAICTLLMVPEEHPAVRALRRYVVVHPCILLRQVAIAGLHASNEAAVSARHGVLRARTAHASTRSGPRATTGAICSPGVSRRSMPPKSRTRAPSL